MKKNILPILSLGTAALIFGVSTLPASAATASTTKAAKQAENLQTVIARGDKEIASRIDDLNKLAAHVQSMKNISDSQKSSVASEVQTEIANLTALKTKIDGDTDITTARTDAKSILTSYRVYALVLPQERILTAADRITTISSILSSVSTKLQSRISTLQTAGKDVAALQTALTDLNAKLSDANTQAESAKNGISSLTPDQGNTTQAAANKTALQTARKDIQAATADIKAARQDVKTILQQIKALHTKAQTSSATSTQ